MVGFFDEANGAAWCIIFRMKMDRITASSPRIARGLEDSLLFWERVLLDEICQYPSPKVARRGLSRIVITFFLGLREMEEMTVWIRRTLKVPRLSRKNAKLAHARPWVFPWRSSLTPGVLILHGQRRRWRGPRILFVPAGDWCAGVMGGGCCAGDCCAGGLI